MNKMLLTTALIALTALSACDNKDDVADTAPAAGEETSMSAPAEMPVDATVTTDETTVTTTTMPSEPVVNPDGSVTSSTTEMTTTTTTEGVAVGEPNPATPAPDVSTCGDHSGLVGKNIADIDTTTLPEGHRVIKPGDAVTMDHRSDRLNVDLDDAGVVTRVHCG